MRGLYGTAAIVAAERAHDVELASGVLMERAATAVAVQAVRMILADRGTTLGARVVVLAGPGNNGGDALFAGAQLAARGIRVDAVGGRMHDGALAALRRSGGSAVPIEDRAVGALIEKADLVIDGILGIGATGPMRSPFAESVPQVAASAALVLAVDVPSGIDADLGLVPGATVRADATVTFAAAKPGHLLAPAASFVGELVVVDIGIADALPAPLASVLDSADVAHLVPAPGGADHKYRRGVVGIAAGSADYPGAALLCTQGAAAIDVGMVRYLVRDASLADAVIARSPQVVRAARVDGPRVDAWVVGPGLAGQDEDVPVVEAALRTGVPVVLDAGALRLLGSRPALGELVRSRPAPTILTPHEGEFVGLGGRLDGGRRAGAADLAEQVGAVVVLKGPGTVVADPDGNCRVDAAGSAVLATAGTGDVLAGALGSVLAGWWARGATGPVVDPVAAAVWLHGTAGRLAGRGSRPVTAPAVADALGEALGQCRADQARPVPSDSGSMREDA